MTDLTATTSGALLKKIREEKGVSLAALAERTGIVARDLAYLEADDYARLPADLYVRNFLERCAFALGIPPENLLRSYRSPLPPQESGAKRLYLNRQLIVTPRILFGIMFLFMGSAVGLYLWYQLSVLIGPPMLVVTNPPGDIMTQDASVTVAGRTQRESHVTVNDMEVAVNAAGAFMSPLALSEGMNIIEIRSVSKLGEEKTVTRRIIKQ